MNDRPDLVEPDAADALASQESARLLQARLAALESRVYRLEQSLLPERPPSAIAATRPAAPADRIQAPNQVIEPRAFNRPADPAQDAAGPGILSVLGKAMLGVAGAYLLRALAEWSTLPRSLVAAAALLYAIGWLVASDRIRRNAQLARPVYAWTSALILAPMLWELTLRFHVLSPGWSAAVLGLFGAVAALLPTSRAHAHLNPAACVTVALLALALSIVTHAMLPYLLVLLLLQCLSEFATLRKEATALRLLAAAAAVCALWVLIVVYRNPASSRLDYPDLGPLALTAPAATIFLVFVASLTLRTFWLRKDLRAWETAQAVLAFVLVMLSAGFFVPSFYPVGSGLVCLGCAAACYAAAWGVFRQRMPLRNFRIVAAWSIALLLSGSVLTFSGYGRLPLLVIAAIVGALIATRIACITLQCHALLCLTVAAATFGFFAFCFDALAGTLPARTPVSVLVLSACAVLCYLVLRAPRSTVNWPSQALVFIPASIAALACTALLTLQAARLVRALWTLDQPRIALLRTVAICTMTLLLAWLASLLRRVELSHLAYAALTLLAVKLLCEDLRRGQFAWIAVSLSFFALTLIAVPRIARNRS